MFCWSDSAENKKLKIVGTLRHKITIDDRVVCVNNLSVLSLSQLVGGSSRWVSLELSVSIHNVGLLRVRWYNMIRLYNSGAGNYGTRGHVLPHFAIVRGHDLQLYFRKNKQLKIIYPEFRRQT